MTRGKLRLYALAVGCFAAGALLSGLVSGHRESRLGHADGACITMDMAVAYGYLDETKRKILTRSITSGLNPYFDRFPDGHRSLLAACAIIEKNRWTDR